jgi:hypothetical protein
MAPVALAFWVTFCTDELLERHRSELRHWLGHFEARTCFKTARSLVLAERDPGESGLAAVLTLLRRYGRMELQRESLLPSSLSPFDDPATYLKM